MTGRSQSSLPKEGTVRVILLFVYTSAPFLSAFLLSVKAAISVIFLIAWLKIVHDLWYSIDWTGLKSNRTTEFDPGSEPGKKLVNTVDGKHLWKRSVTEKLHDFLSSHNREVIEQLVSDYVERIDELYDVRVTHDVKRNKPVFMLAVMADDGEKTEQEMKEITDNIEAWLDINSFTYRKNESLTRIEDNEVCEWKQKHPKENPNRPGRYIEYHVGPLSVNELPVGYLTEPEPLLSSVT